jgi:hypothetical protein
MQPCEVCGGMGVDAAGYCTQCRTYRGVPPTSGAPYPPQQQSPYGQNPHPVSGGGYAPTSGAPYPYAGAPGAGYPQSGPPAQSSVPPMGYPGQYPQQQYAPPAPAPTPTPGPARSRGLALPLIALSATLVVIVVAIVVVAIMRSGTRKPFADGGGRPNPDTSTVVVDQCVVGTWAITSDEEDVVMDQVGTVRFSGRGGEARLKADGTGSIDYGRNGPAKFTATYKDQPVELVVTGTVTFDYRTAGGAMSFSNMKANGNLAMTVGGLASTNLPLEVSDDPAKYSCTDTTLTQTTTLQTVRFTRTSRDT